jgi:hypothetical protein
MRRKITIPLTTTASAHAAEDVIFLPTEVKNAASRIEGDVKIISASLISKGDKCPSVDLVFTEKGDGTLAQLGVGDNIGTGGGTLRSSLLDNQICGILTLDEVTDGNTGALVSTYVSTKSNVDLVLSTSLKVAEYPNPTSFHVFGITKTAVTTTAVDDFTLILDIE